MGRWPNETRWDHLVRDESARTGVPVWVIKATIAQESSFDPKAYRAERRPDGTIWDASRGLMQLLYGTARSVGYTGPPGDDVHRIAGLFTPRDSIKYGTAYLATIATRYPGEPWHARYAAYNSGAVRRNKAGEFVNSKGETNVNRNVRLWTEKANYFREQEGLVPLPLSAPAAAGS